MLVVRYCKNFVEGRLSGRVFNEQSSASCVVYFLSSVKIQDTKLKEQCLEGQGRKVQKLTCQCCNLNLIPAPLVWF